MSSVCPEGRPPGQDKQGNMSGNTGGYIGFFALGGGENSRHCFMFEGKRVRNCKFCKMADGTHRDIYHGDESKKGFYKMRSITSSKN